MRPTRASKSRPRASAFAAGVRAIRAGKQTFVAVCGGCHDITRARAGYTPAGWITLQHMMENFGATVPPEDWPTLLTYLMKNFPESDYLKSGGKKKRVPWWRLWDPNW